MKKKLFTTIRSKITFSVILLSILFSIIISIVFYSNFKKSLISSMVDVTDASLRLVMDSLDEDLKQVQSIIEWSTINSDLSDILILDNSNRIYDKDILKFLDKIAYMVNSSKINKYINKIIIHGEQGVTMQLGLISGHGSDVELCISEEWFDKLLENKSLQWLGLVENPFKYRNEKYIIPTVRPVYSYNKQRNVGWLMIGLNSNLVHEYIHRYTAYEDSDIMIFNNEGQIISHKNSNLIGTYLENLDTTLENTANNEKGYFNIEINQKQRIAVYYKSPTTGWIILQVLSNIEIEEQQDIFTKIIASTVIIVVFLGILLSVTLGYYISRPIKVINSKLKSISKGDFSIAPNIESSDELGEIGKAINQMSGDIVNLMEKSVDNEKSKRELELKVLQTQVNPHFLYNTLNSIKWMATIQKTTGISEMATALSRLLRNMAKGVSKEITLKEELSLVNDYVLIQKFRYGDSFNVIYNISDDLESYKIIKFTIQPLVENAIFHGIEPNLKSGEINIDVIKQDKIIFIYIKDNGVGMKNDKIKSVLNANDEGSKGGLSGIGISNVNERIKLTYGEEYGIDITSQEGAFTEIIIRIPAKV